MLFDRLGVFRGGFTLEAVESVCSGEGIEPAEVLDLLGALIDKSLVTTSAPSSGPARYFMLETLRQYSLSRLGVRDETDQTRRRHAEFYLALAENASPRLETPEMPVWLDRLEADHDNFRAALAWSLDASESLVALRLTRALSVWFWFIRRHHEEGLAWHQQALEIGDDAPAGLLADTLAMASMQAMRIDGKHDEAIALADRTLAIARTGGNARAEIMATATRGDVAYYNYDNEGAEPAFRRALHLAEEVGDHVWLSRLWYFLSWVSINSERLQEARDRSALAIAAAQRAQWPMGLAESQGQAGDHALEAGDLDAALELAKQYLTIEEELNDPFDLTQAHTLLSTITRRKGEPATALEYAERALKLGRDFGHPALIAAVLVEATEVYLDLDLVGRAATASVEALEVIRGTRFRWRTARTLATAAGVLAATTDWGLLATTLATVNKVMEELGGSLRNWEMADIDERLAKARAALGTDAFDEAWSRGLEINEDATINVIIDALEGW